MLVRRERESFTDRRLLVELFFNLEIVLLTGSAVLAIIIGAFFLKLGASELFIRL